MNVILVQPNTKDKKPPKNTSWIKELTMRQNRMPPLGIMLLASCLAKHDHEINIIDAEAEKLSDDETARKVIEYNPEIVGLYINSRTLYQASNISKKIKENDKNVKIIIGGPLLNYFPKQILKCAHFDVGIIGESEEAICELVSALKKNKDLSGIKGIVYKKDKKVYMTQKREINPNLDKLPFPAWHLIKIGLYRRINTKYRVYASLIINRGCNFRCIFCDTPLRYNHKVIERSVKNIIAELILLNKVYKKKDIVFVGENFTFNKEKALNLCNEMIKNKLNLAWQCRTRVNLVDEDLIKTMSEAGCYLIYFGLESGNDKILKILKKDITKEQAKKAIALTKKYGIETIGNFIIGNPHETKKTIKETINFAIDSNPTFVYFQPTILFPPTSKLTKWAEKRGYFNYKKRDILEMMLNNKRTAPILETPELDKKTILNSCTKAYLKFYFRPTKMLHTTIRTIRRYFSFS